MDEMNVVPKVDNNEFKEKVTYSKEAGMNKEQHFSGSVPSCRLF